MNSGDYIEAVVRLEICPVSCCRKGQDVGRNSPKNWESFQQEYCFHVPAISDIFLQDPETETSVLDYWPEIKRSNCFKEYSMDSGGHMDGDNDHLQIEVIYEYDLL
ncbi:hypothetical protein I4U23_018156 [Adineta vaga]|nr:hypothetical protein I4U23_018156 [Adineta vaga]